LNIASLGSHPVPKFFKHVSEYHLDEGFVFDQEYGCFSEHFVPTRSEEANAEVARPVSNEGENPTRLLAWLGSSDHSSRLRSSSIRRLR
jgi:hypothetical protein